MAKSKSYIKINLKKTFLATCGLQNKPKSYLATWWPQEKSLNPTWLDGQHCLTVPILHIHTLLAPEQYNSYGGFSLYCIWTTNVDKSVFYAYFKLGCLSKGKNIIGKTPIGLNQGLQVIFSRNRFGLKRY